MVSASKLEYIVLLPIANLKIHSNRKEIPNLLMQIELNCKIISCNVLHLIDYLRQIRFVFEFCAFSIWDIDGIKLY